MLPLYFLMGLIISGLATEHTIPFSYIPGDIVRTSDNSLFLATTSGIQRYSQGKWEPIPLANRNRYYVRTLRYDAASNMIFWGGLHDFGYLNLNTDYPLQAVSLQELVHTDLRRAGYITHIIHSGSKTWFLSRYRVFMWQNGIIESIRLPAAATGIFEIQGTIYVAVLQHGLLSWDYATFRPVFETDPFARRHIRGMVALPNSNVLIATAGDGLWLFDTTQKEIQTLKEFLPTQIQHFRVRNLRSFYRNGERSIVLSLHGYGEVVFNEHLEIKAMLPYRNLPVSFLFSDIINHPITSQD